MELAEKAVRMRTLLEEVRVGTERSETVRLLDSMADLLEELAMETERVRDRQTYLMESVGSLLEALFSDEEEDENEEDDSEADGDEAELDGDAPEEEDDYWDSGDEEGFYMTECPVCGEALAFGEDVMEAGGAECPSCGTWIQLEQDETT